MIGRRYLRSTGNRFLSFISAISMAGRGDRRRSADRRAVGHERLRARAAQPHPEHDLACDDYRVRRRFGRLAGRCARGARQSGVAGAAPYRRRRGAADRRCKSGATSAASVRGMLPELRAQVSAVGERLQLRRDSSALPAGEYGIVARRGARQAAAGRASAIRVVLAIAQGSVTPAGVVPRLRRFIVGRVRSGMYEIDRRLRSCHSQDARACSGSATTSRDCG